MGRIKVYSFDLCGYMAHFRKRYTTSSALTYYLPPRTTITGIIANLLGMPRDSYYEQFSSEKMQIAVACKSEARRIVQGLNLLHIEGTETKKCSSQTKFEFLVPKEDYLRYRIWLAGDSIKELDELFNDGIYKSRGASVSLGPAFTLGWIENISTIQGTPGAEQALIHSAVPDTTEIFISPENKIFKEDLFLDFSPQRNPKNFRSIVFDVAGKPIKCNAKYTRLESGENIMFLSST